jgi:hypothetical protein
MKCHKVYTPNNIDFITFLSKTFLYKVYYKECCNYYLLLPSPDTPAFMQREGAGDPCSE